MKTTFISTSVDVAGYPALADAILQVKLADAQKEVATGRHADVGASLGYSAGQAAFATPGARPALNHHRHQRRVDRVCRRPKPP